MTGVVREINTLLHIWLATGPLHLHARDAASDGREKTRDRMNAVTHRGEPPASSRSAQRARFRIVSKSKTRTIHKTGRTAGRIGIFKPRSNPSAPKTNARSLLPMGPS